MREYQGSVRYARALLGLAEEQNALEKIDSDFEQVIRLIDKHPEITHLVTNSTIGKNEKDDFLEKVFPESTAKLLINFLKVLIAKKRFKQVHDIQTIFHHFFEQKKGVQEVTVVTAVPLTRSTEEKLKTALEKRLKSQIRLIQEVDRNILGGMVVRIGNSLVDLSLKSKIESIAHAAVR